MVRSLLVLGVRSLFVYRSYGLPFFTSFFQSQLNPANLQLKAILELSNFTTANETVGKKRTADNFWPQDENRPRIR